MVWCACYHILDLPPLPFKTLTSWPHQNAADFSEQILYLDHIYKVSPPPCIPEHGFPQMIAPTPFSRSSNSTHTFVSIFWTGYQKVCSTTTNSIQGSTSMCFFRVYAPFHLHRLPTPIGVLPSGHTHSHNLLHCVFWLYGWSS